MLSGVDVSIDTTGDQMQRQSEAVVKNAINVFMIQLVLMRRGGLDWQKKAGSNALTIALSLFIFPVARSQKFLGFGTSEFFRFYEFLKLVA